MADPRTRDEFKERIYQNLGVPVIEVNIADEQVENCIDDALSFWRDYHYDAQNKIYIAHQLTQQDVDTKKIALDPSISAVTRIFKFVGDAASGAGSDDIFNVDYQLRLNDLWDLTSVNLGGYVIARQYINMIDDILNVDLQVRFKELEGVLYIDTAAFRLPVGQYLMIEAYQNLTGDGIWRSRVFRQLATAYARRQWALNMLKYEGTVLPGGVTVNATNMLQVADMEIQKNERDFILNYQAPDEFYMA